MNYYTQYFQCYALFNVLLIPIKVYTIPKKDRNKSQKRFCDFVNGSRDDRLKKHRNKVEITL